MANWICSADAHFLEPGDLWLNRMPASMRTRAPRMETEDGCRVYFLEGKRKIKIPNSVDYLADGSPVPKDVPGRLKFLERDGIWAESLLGSLGTSLVLSIRDPELAIASARVYNDYVHETFRSYRDRLLAPAIITVHDIPAAVREIDRVARLGLPAINLPMNPPEPYFLEKYEPIWAAAAAHRLHLSFHAGTGIGSSGIPGFSEKIMPDGPRALAGLKTTRALELANEAFRVLAALVGTGALERHPDLHVIFVETNAGWLAYAMEAMEATWTPAPGEERFPEEFILYDEQENERHIPAEQTPLGARWPYPLRPSEYVRRQVHLTFQDDPAAIKFRAFTGTAPLLWGSDFPHAEGTWPHSRDVVNKLFAGVDAPERDAIVGGTFARLFGLQVPAA